MIFPCLATSSFFFSKVFCQLLIKVIKSTDSPLRRNYWDIFLIILIFYSSSFEPFKSAFGYKV